MPWFLVEKVMLLLLALVLSPMQSVAAFADAPNNHSLSQHLPSNAISTSVDVEHLEFFETQLAEANSPIHPSSQKQITNDTRVIVSSLRLQCGQRKTLEKHDSSTWDWTDVVNTPQLHNSQHPALLEGQIAAFNLASHAYTPRWSQPNSLYVALDQSFLHV